MDDVPPIAMFLQRDSLRFRSAVYEIILVLMSLHRRVPPDERWRVEYLLIDMIDLSEHFYRQPIAYSDTLPDEDLSESTTDDIDMPASNASMGGDASA